jgi:hypothetical protein
VLLCAVVYEPAPETRRPETLAALAAALNSLAFSQSAAVAAAEEAVAILHELAVPRSPEAPALPRQPAGEPEQGPEHSIARSAATGFGRIPALRLARLGRRSTRWPGPIRAALAALPAGSWPLVLELGLYLFARPYALVTVDAMSWVAALAVINISVLAVVRRIWSMMHRAGPSIDELVARSARRDQLTKWLWRSLGPGRQILLSLLMAAGASTLLALAEPAISDQLEIGPVSYVAVAWTAFIAGNAAYLVLVMAGLGYRLLRLRDLNLVWHSPASTPGIAQLSSTYTYGTGAILILAIAVEILALRVSTYGDSVVLNTVSIVLPVAAAVVALSFGVLPHWWLYLAVRDARREALSQLSRPGPVPHTPAGIAEAQARISLYRMVESSPGLPFSTGSMVQYAAAVISTLVGTVLAIVLGRG